MPRSVWKGPFFDGYLLKKAENVSNVLALKARVFIMHFRNCSTMESVI